MSTPTENKYSLLDIIGIVYRWRKRILILCAATALVSVIIVLLLPNYYTATAIIAPANEEKELFNEDGTKDNSLYGDEDALDRTLIFANSSALVDYMARNFNLAERYGIDTSTAKGQDRLARRFRKLYDVRKNEHSGIEISVQDTDPEMAAKLTNGVVQGIATLRRNATLKNKELLMQTYEITLADKRKDLAVASDSMIKMRTRYSIFDVDQQGEMLASLVVSTESQLAESMAKLTAFEQSGRRDSVINQQAKVQGLTRKLELLREDNDTLAGAANLATYNKGRGWVVYYDRLIDAINKDIGLIQSQYAQFRAQANSKASAVIVLEPAEVPKVKSYPSRSLIVIGVTLLAAVLGVAAALLLDIYKKIDWKSVFQPPTQD